MVSTKFLTTKKSTVHSVHIKIIHGNVVFTHKTGKTHGNEFIPSKILVSHKSAPRKILQHPQPLRTEISLSTLAPLRTRHSGSTRNILFTCFRISLTSCSDHFSTAVSRAGETKKRRNSTTKPSNTSRKRSKSHYSWLILFKSFQISSDTDIL